MAQTFEKIPDEFIPWIEEQPLFFVATALPTRRPTSTSRPAGSTPSGPSVRTASPGSTSPAVAWRR